MNLLVAALQGSAMGPRHQLGKVNLVGPAVAKDFQLGRLHIRRAEQVRRARVMMAAEIPQVAGFKPVQVVVVQVLQADGDTQALRRLGQVLPCKQDPAALG